ncbi:MAG: glycosyltransferase [Phycisphaera sp.]|nr:glycosyltransferase [Phycisphaera sp.]
MSSAEPHDNLANPANPDLPAPTPAPADAACPDVSVVIPCYNETKRLGRTLTGIRDWAATYDGRVQVVVVDDGSADGTADLARGFDAGPLDMAVLVNDRNHGKGYSVKRGMLAADGAVRVMSDADLATPMTELPKMLPWFEQGYDVVIASRGMPDSQVDPPRPPHRQLMYHGFCLIRRMILLPRLKDTQCGFKAFTARAAHDVFEHLITEGFAFDCEALALAERLGYRVKEVGVEWHNGAGSTVNPIRDSPRMVMDLVRIRRRLRKLDPHSIRKETTPVSNTMSDTGT